MGDAYLSQSLRISAISQCRISCASPMRTTQLTRQRAAAIYRAKRLTALSVACLAAVGLTACGNSGELPANAVARVGNTTITTALFDHWMLALLGSDYSERGSSRAPVMRR
jgi:hypothetical protein